MTRTASRIAALLATVAATAAAHATTVSQRPFGQLPDGTAIAAVTLTNTAGMRVTILTLGASVQSVIVPDRAGHFADVALGYPDIAGYVAKPNFFGATVGRVANRIAKGRFTLDGKSYAVPLSDGPNSLHGGTKGFDKVAWQLVSTAAGPTATVVLRYVSPDGDQGYPGILTTTATYALDEAGALSIDYRATTDRPTIVNLSNHTYWNLSGEGSANGAMGERLTIPAEAYSPTDATDPQLRYGRGYDHNWVVSRTRTAAPRLMARVEDPASGRVLEILSDQPGIQFYSGNFLDGTIVGKAGHLYREGDAIVLEPQMFPDTPNRPEFGSVRLAPGQTYANRIVFRFSIAPAH